MKLTLEAVYNTYNNSEYFLVPTMCQALVIILKLPHRSLSEETETLSAGIKGMCPCLIQQEQIFSFKQHFIQARTSKLREQYLHSSLMIESAE